MLSGRRAHAGVVSGVVLAFAFCGPAIAQQQQQTTPATPAQTTGAPKPAGGPSQSDLDLIKQLKAGGLVIVMRHTQADPDKADTNPLDFKNTRTQQPLTEQGRLTARTFGENLRTIGVAISDVQTSRFNRAYQTAVLAGFKNAKPVTELTEGGLVTSPNEQRRRAASLKQLVAAPLPENSNRLLITHRICMTNAFGKEWFEVKEGETSIFRSDKGSYALIARLQLFDWNRLAAIAQSPPN